MFREVTLIKKQSLIERLLFKGARRLQQMLGDKNAEELEAYYKKKFAETSDR